LVATHDFIISNGTGASVRSDLNGALAAIATNNSSATAPATTYAYQWWADTTTGLLKQRNAANSAFVTIGTLASTNLGLASLAGATFTGDVILGTTTALELPDGTTGQRPGSPVAGMIRFNTTVTQFEGYNGTAWSAVGGGATGGGPDTVFFENGQTVTTSYTLTTNKNAVTAGPVTVNSGVIVTIPSGSSWVVV
jgi:hypothetical protein